jgi:uncharacterized protein
VGTPSLSDPSMIRIQQVRLPLDHDDDRMLREVARCLRMAPRDIERVEVYRQAIDARRKTDVKLVYTVDVELRDGRSVDMRRFGGRVVAAPDESYTPPSHGPTRLEHRPVVIGSGPAGLFATLLLAQQGYRPLLLERGKPVEQRCVDVERFWRDGVLDPESNAQFGEGGAGTFSDGKLNTLVNDPRCRQVLRTLVECGAPPSILVQNKPHVGTDKLRAVVRSLRERIVEFGGEIRFGARLTGIEIENSLLTGIRINANETIACSAAVLAIGHSSRDTFQMLHEAGVAMERKPFAIGVRIEHLQRDIDSAQFGPSAGHPRLGAADYKLAWHGPHGRSAYTFCMCPGGQVIAASSNTSEVVTNGMSLHARAGVNANAALLVNVIPEDFGGSDVLAGFAFQAQWEQTAFRVGGSDYRAPVQRVGDLLQGAATKQFGNVQPTYTPGVTPADLQQILPEYVVAAIRNALPVFGRRLRGFDHPDAILTGVETRSSCPVRILRDDSLQCSVRGLYPAGEGAGYAGGIMSSAVDGMRCAEAIVRIFSPCKT